MSATSVPDRLRKLDVTRFVQRGAQLEKFKPAIAYWCYYRAVQQILATGVQSENDCKAYTGALLEKLESLTAQHGTDETIKDDIAAAAYVEQFGLETFQRADNAVRANKVTRQTADTFQAAATFLDLLSLWNNGPSPEVASKIKFAKFHALRIAKAIKAGEDPNASNPPQDSDVLEGAEPELDPDDPEVQKINIAAALQPSLQDAEDGDELPHSTAAVSQTETKVEEASAAGNYFPPLSTPGDISPPVVPAPPSPSIQNIRSESTPQHSAPPPPPAPLPHSSAASDFVAVPRVAVPPAAPISQPAAGALATDDEAIANAQKHAKWAISALNFEDVSTAVKELQSALAALGAR